MPSFCFERPQKMRAGNCSRCLSSYVLLGAVCCHLVKNPMPVLDTKAQKTDPCQLSPFFNVNCSINSSFGSYHMTLMSFLNRYKRLPRASLSLDLLDKLGNFAVHLAPQKFIKGTLGVFLLRVLRTWTKGSREKRRKIMRMK